MYGPLVGKGIRSQSLVVHLMKPGSSGVPAKEGYVGWTGMASASSLVQLQSQTSSRSREGSSVLETVEIDPQFAGALGFDQGDVIEIGLLHDLPVATSIATEPLSADDWEILELHAGYVEDNMLAQVRAACVDQELDVWILGRTRIRFRVVSINPPTTSSKKAVLLGTDTEVSIAPKLRGQLSGHSFADKNQDFNRETLSASTPADKNAGSSPNAKPHPIRPLALRHFPMRLIDASSLPPHGSSDDVCAIYVSPTSFSRIFGGTRPMADLALYASIRVLPAPTIKNIPVTGGAGSATAGASLLPSPDPLMPVSKQLLLNGKDKQRDDEYDKKNEAEKIERVAFRALRGVPERHAVIFGQLPRSDIGEWDLISVHDGETKETSEAEIDGFDDSAKTLRHLRVSKPQKQATDLAGIDSTLDSITSFILRSFALQGDPAGGPDRDAALMGIPAILLCGAPGSGRTSVAKEVVRRMSIDERVFAHHVYVDLAKLSDERIMTLRTLFERYIDIASWHRPSVLVLDNLDRVISPEVEHADSSRQRQLAENFISLFSPTRRVRGVVLLATCQGPTSLHSLLISTHIFSDRITLKSPDKNARRDIICRLVEKHMAASDLSLDPTQPLNYVALATQTEGYSATDLRDLVSRAVHQAAICLLANGQGGSIQIRSKDFASAQVGFTPLSLRDVKLQRSEVEWSDIGGLHETRRVLRETLEWPTKYGAIFAKCPIRLRSGLLLYGYPGCGKTLLASAVAKECGLNFISVKGPELLNKYIGASEKSVRDLFDRAVTAGPCVLFFDEFDSIAPKRGHDSTGVTDRVVNQLLTQMDGAEGLDGVYVLAATSRPDLIDSALLRPGRLDKSLLCNMPDPKERAEILNTLRRKVTLSDDINIEEYARQTDGFSGADLQALVYNAHLLAVHASIAEAEAHRPFLQTQDVQIALSPTAFTTFGGPAGSIVLSQADETVRERRLELIAENLGQRNAIENRRATESKSKPIVLDAHLRTSLKSTRPSVSPEERARLSRIYAAFVSDRSGEMQVPPEAGGIGARASLG